VISCNYGHTVCVEGCTCIQETKAGSVFVQASYILIPNVRGGGKRFLEEGRSEQHSDWSWSLILVATPNGRDSGKGFLEEGKRE
jgi:hypothetical protein